MYVITKNNKRTFKTVFDSYEEARSALRKHLRKTRSFMSWAYSNPTISDLGYSIKQI